MKNVLIVENQTESLHLNESVKNSSKVLLSGSFTEFDIENRNKRFYTANNFLPVMNNLLEKKKMLGVIYGEFDHPDVFDIAGKNASHAIENLTYNESNNRVDGTIALLSTHWGKEAKAIINDGYPLFVSSRAAGVTDANNNVMLKELFTYDIVLDPGFATSNVSVNESFGYNTNQDVPYRIYEMKDADVENLHIDNKNDNKTKMDLKYMESLLADKMAKIEHQIMEKLSDGKFNPEEMRTLTEKYESTNDELKAVNKYLEEFTKKMNHIIKENTNLKNVNKTLITELNETTLYSNHLASGLKKLNEQNNDILSRLSIDEKMIEYVAVHTKANILMTEDLSTNVFKMNEDLVNNEDFLQYVANETKIAQDFAEKFAQDAASEIKTTQEFLENTAKETETAQKFAEYVANESYKDQIFLDYISEKVDGIVGYSQEVVNTLKNNTPISEHVNSNIETIHNLSDIEDYLGVTEEKEIINNVTEEIIDGEDTTEEETEEEIADVTETPIETETEDNIDTVNTESSMDIQPLVDGGTEPTIDIENDTNLETTLLSSLVKVLGTDDTGIVIEITPDNKIIIQKSGTDDTMELGESEYEVLDLDDNLTETVSNVLYEIQKQKILANQQPHFMSFLNEQQITDFKSFEKNIQNKIVLAMDSSEYYTAEDVLNIIGKTLNENNISYEEKLISNIPENIKEVWNTLDVDKKTSILTESKYFVLSTSSDITNFWNTRPFAKSVTSNDSILIKESITTESDKLSDEYINAFLSSVNTI